MWVRIQKDPGNEIGSTEIEFYADGRLVKSKSIQSEDFFLEDQPARVVTVGGNWFLFYDSHPGAGDTWFTNYLVIRKRDLRFGQKGQFEHGDALEFQSSHRFYEYKYLKYQGDYRYRKLGVTGYQIIDWRWNTRQARFQKVRHWYAPYLPRHLRKQWWEHPQLRLHGNLVGTLDYFQPADPSKYDLPKDGHFVIPPGYAFGKWTIGLVAGKPTEDELNLVHGLKDLAGLDYPIGSMDPHHPPQISRSSKGIVLTLTTYAFRQVRFSKFLVTTKPYKIELLGTWKEPEWTPFAQSNSVQSAARRHP